MIRHPSVAVLRSYVDDELTARKRHKVKAHLAECAICRETIRTWRSAAKEIREGPIPVLPPDLLYRIQARAAKGERIILPTAGPGVPPRPPMWTAAAAVIALLLIGSAVLFSTPKLKADTSELRFAPERPRPGQEIRIEYQPSSLLAGETTVKLRGRFRTAADEEFNEFLPTLTVTQLKRDRNGLFRGTFRLPDSAVYGTFAVEDSRGERVDHNRRRFWDILVHERNGRPSWDALNQQRSELAGRNWERALEIAREMVRLHPEHPGSGMVLLAYQSEIPGVASQDSLLRTHRDLFRRSHERLTREPEVSTAEAVSMLFYAMRLGENASTYWRERLIDEHPLDPTAVHMRTWEVVWAHPGDTSAILAGLERLWQEVGPITEDPASQALRMARLRGDGDEIVKWAGRLERVVPDITSAEVWASLLSSTDDHRIRRAALPHLRRAVRLVDAKREQDRPLGRSVEEQRLENEARSGELLAAIGVALIRESQREAGLDTLKLAAERGWNVDVFRQIAEVQTEVRDTANALLMWTRVVAEPGTSKALEDSVRFRIGSGLKEQEWLDLVATARETMRRRVLAGATSRVLRGDIRLADQDGREWGFDQLSLGSPTVVVFWSRYSGPATHELKRLRIIGDALATQGAKIITITADRPSSDLRRFLDEGGYTFPVFYDIRGDAKRVFNQWGTPAYYVLDSDGRVRFEGSSPEAVLRQVTVLTPLQGARGQQGE